MIVLGLLVLLAVGGLAVRDHCSRRRRSFSGSFWPAALPLSRPGSGLFADFPRET